MTSVSGTLWLGRLGRVLAGLTVGFGASQLGETYENRKAIMSELANNEDTLQAKLMLKAIAKYGARRASTCCRAHPGLVDSHCHLPCSPGPTHPPTHP